MYEFLDAARDWLLSQPGMSSWPRGRARLVARIEGWIDDYGAKAFGRPLKADEPASEECGHKLWRCWEHHWRQAAEIGGGSADGFEVAERLENGLGFKGGGRLGSNPLEDIVLAVAVLHQEPAAIEWFSERFRSGAIGVAVKNNPRVREDTDDWWCQLLVHLMGMGDRPGKLERYEGRCGLWNWLVRVVRNFTANWGRALLGDSDPLEWEIAPARNLAEESECQKLLGGVIRRAIGQLPAKQGVLLYFLFARQLPGKDVAGTLGVHPGNIGRQKDKAIRQLREALTSLDGSAVHVKGYRDCLENLSGTRNLRELADIFLSVLSKFDPDKEAPSKEDDA